jgi:Tol biopolymer transport system component
VAGTPATRSIPIHTPHIPIRSLRITLLLTALACASLVPSAVVAQVPPDARWYTFETPNFRVHYSDGLETVARRAADRAEVAHAELVETLIEAPRGRVDLLIADNVDFANGYATPFPTNRIVIYAHPPVDEPSLAFYDDWLQLVVTHELVHIFHLDHASGAPLALRRLFGRVPFSFPNAFVPRWITEGLAVHYESRLTGAGRIRGTMHDMVLRTAVLQDTFFSIDRVTGDPVTWPGGNAAYIYGSMFIDHLATLYGPETAGEFVRVMGRRIIPYRVDAAGRAAYGVGFVEAWSAWHDSLQAHYSALADSLRAEGLTPVELLTDGGRMQQFPRWSPDGRRIAFARATGREETAVTIREEDGTLTRVTPRTGIGPAAWHRDGNRLVTAQIDAVDAYRYLSDLYEVDSVGGQRRLTRAARITEPDVHPADGRIVAVRNVAGTNTLVVLERGGGAPRELVPPSLDVHWALPRWSPDGTRIAAARWRAGGFHDVVVMDADGGAILPLTRTRAIDTAPAWSPDGRYVLFSSDRTGIANLFAHDLEMDEVRQVTNVLTGAFQPDVSPDGRWIAFSVYGANGYDLARMPYDPDGWRPAPPLRPEILARTGDPADFQRTAGGPARRYSPARSLRPAYWLPVIETQDQLGTFLGISTDGADLVGRHRYTLSASVVPASGRAEAWLGYRYAGLGNPVLGTSGFQRWNLRARPGSLTAGDGQVIRTALVERERSGSAVATFTRPRFRSYGWVSFGASVVDRHREWNDPAAAHGRVPVEIPLDVGGVTSTGFSTLRAFPFSVSTEQGILAAAAVEGRRYTRPFAGEDRARGYWRTTGRGQAFQPLELPGFARHVIALRASGGADWGSRAPGFTAGGLYGPATAYPLGTGTGTGSRLAFPVRGYPEGAQSGDRAASFTAEYRFPLLLVERGVRLFPVFLNRFWGAAFADAGGAWCEGTCALIPGDPEDTFRPLASVGAELGTELTVGFFGGMSLVGGAALPLRDYAGRDGPLRPTPSVYLRAGLPF